MTSTAISPELITALKRLRLGRIATTLEWARRLTDDDIKLVRGEAAYSEKVPDPDQGFTAADLKDAKKAEQAYKVIQDRLAMFAAAAFFITGSTYFQRWRRFGISRVWAGAERQRPRGRCGAPSPSTSSSCGPTWRSSSGRPGRARPSRCLPSKPAPG